LKIRRQYYIFKEAGVDGYYIRQEYRNGNTERRQKKDKKAVIAVEQKNDLSEIIELAKKGILHLSTFPGKPLQGLRRCDPSGRGAGGRKEKYSDS